MRRMVGTCAVVGLMLVTGCGGGGDEDVAAAQGPVLPGPQVTPKGAEALVATGTWGLNDSCVYLTSPYGPIAPSFPKGWTYDAKTKTVTAPDGSARGRIGQKVSVTAVSLPVVPKAQALCAGAAIQVLKVSVAK